MRSSSLRESSLNFFYWCVFFALLFILFTNAIPFIQLGWLHPLKSKTRYANLLNISAVLFFAVTLLLFFRRREAFLRLDLPQFWNHISERAGRCGAFVLAAIYFFSGVLVGFARHLSIQTRAFDLGIFDQAIWNTLKGHFLLSSLKENTCLLGDHFSPLLVLLTPLYAIHPSPVTLLVIQAFAQALCIPLIYHLARRLDLEPRTALCFAAAFFLFYPERSALHEDFHPEILVQPLFFLVFLFMKSRKWPLFLLTLGLCLSAKENFSGIVFILGFFLVLFEEKRFLGLFLMVFAVAYLWLITHWVIPSISGHPYLYGGFYKSLTENPIFSVRRLLDAGAFTYVIKLFSPVLFLSFFHPPSLLLTAPILIQNLLSENEVTRSFGYHYTAGLSPFVFISGLCGWKWLSARISSATKGWVCAGILLAGILRSGPSEYFYFYNSFEEITPRTKLQRSAIKEIPEHAVVLTHNNWVPQLSGRKEIYQFEYNPKPSKIEQAIDCGAEYVLFDQTFWEPQSKPLNETLVDFREAGFVNVFEAEGFYLLRKRSVKNS